MPPVHSKPALKLHEHLYRSNPDLLEALEKRAGNDSRVGMALKAILQSPPRIREQPSHMVFVKSDAHDSYPDEAHVIVPAPGGEAYLLVQFPANAFNGRYWGTHGYQPEMLCADLQAITRRVPRSIWEALSTKDQREIITIIMSSLSNQFVGDPQEIFHETKPTLYEALGIDDHSHVAISHSNKGTARSGARDNKAFMDNKAILQNKLNKLVKEVQVISSALADFNMDQGGVADHETFISADQDNSEETGPSYWDEPEPQPKRIHTQDASVDTGIWGGKTKLAYPVMTPATSDDGWGIATKYPTSRTRTPIVMSGGRSSSSKDPFVDTKTRVMPGDWVDEPFEDHVYESQTTRGKNKATQASTWGFTPKGWFGSSYGGQPVMTPATKRAGAKEKGDFSRKSPKWTDPSGATHWVSNPYIPPRTCPIHKNTVVWGDFDGSDPNVSSLGAADSW